MNRLQEVAKPQCSFGKKSFLSKKTIPLFPLFQVMGHTSLTRRSNYSQYNSSPFLYGEQPSDSDLLHSLGLGVVGRNKALVRSCLFLLSQWHDEIALTQLISRLRIYILNGQAESESEDWQWFITECEQHCQGTKD